ncbi:hypothetical protein C6H68_02745 [Photorhabdus luminescens]|nr:hypothetical protein C6H68_02745 [Photorhabdus luminescens]
MSRIEDFFLLEEKIRGLFLGRIIYNRANIKDCPICNINIKKRSLIGEITMEKTIKKIYLYSQE